MAQTKVSLVDLNSNELILDLDGDTTLHSSTDDQIDIKIAGADDFTFTAGAFNVLASSHAVFADSSEAKFGAGTDLQIYHDGTNSFIANKTGALKIATETSGIAITLGHTTSEVTIADNLTVTGNANIGGSLTFADGSIALADIDIDGGTDIGADLTTSDLIIIDDGAGGTNRKAALSRINTLVQTAGGFPLTALDIDGGTDIGAAIVDADLFIVDDGAGGTNRKVTASRIKTYIGSTTAVDDLTLGDAAVTIATSSGNITIDAQAGDTDIIFKGTDGSSDITALTLDMSADGAAIFKSSVTAVSLDISGDVDVDGTTNLDVVDIDGAVDMASTLTVTGAAILNGGIDINGNLTIDVDGSAITLADGGVNFGQFYNNASGTFNIVNPTQDKDIVFRGDDGGTGFVALTLDMSNAGAAAFNSTVTATGFIIGSANIAEAELELLDGLTAGTAIASKVVTTDANIDSTGIRNLTLSGNLILGSATVTEAQAEILDGATVTTTELNLIDGGATVGTTAIADGDGLLINDAGTMRVSTVQTLAAYLDDEITAMPNLVTVGAANTASSVAGIPIFFNGTNSLYTHDVSGTQDAAVQNAAYGNNALDAITTGDGNTAIGSGSASGVTTGTRNIALGRSSLDSPDTENDNLAIGYNALAGTIAGGEYNVAVGNYSLDALTSGDYNTTLGYNAGSALTTGVRNVIIGSNAGDTMVQGSSNVIIGDEALGGGLFTASKAVVIGRNAGFDMTSAAEATLVGYEAGLNMTTGAGNTILGAHAVGAGVLTGANNVVIGKLAGNDMTSAAGNVLIGEDAGANITTAVANVIIGQGAGETPTSASYNIAIGLNAGASMTTGDLYNTLVGHSAGSSLTSGNRNIFMGASAGDGHDTETHNLGIGVAALGGSIAGGEYNVAVGNYALDALTSADFNTAVGYDAGGAVTSGGYNTLLGHQAGHAITSGNTNTAVGHHSLGTNTVGDRNTAVGSGALGTFNPSSNTDDNNTAVGYGALNALTTGVHNIAIGGLAMGGDPGPSTENHNLAIGINSMGGNIAGGEYNVAIGNYSGDAITSGDSNTLVGYNVGTSITTSELNTFIGFDVGKQHSTNAGGSVNTGVGASALQALTTGGQNTAIGGNAGYNLTNAFDNVLVGHNTGDALILGSHNTAVGKDALGGAQGDRYNVAIGFEALKVFNTGTSVNDTENVAVGVQAGLRVTSGSAHTLIGGSAGNNITTGSNNSCLGQGSGGSASPRNITNESNNIVLGNNSITDASIKVDWTVTSDKRDKTDVETLTMGLDFVNQLNPVTYRWDMRSDYDDATPDGTHKKQKLFSGLLAQDVETLERTYNYKVEDETALITSKGEDGNYGLTYQRLIPVLINAVKELSAKVDALEG